MKPLKHQTPLLTIRPSDLLCAACYAGGCRKPAAGVAAVQAIIARTRRDSWLPIRLLADTNLGCAHFNSVYGGNVSGEFRSRQADYARRFRDLEVLRRMGLQPGDVRPAYELVQLLFKNILSLDGICRFEAGSSAEWPAISCAGGEFYERARGDKLMINKGISIGGVANNPLYHFLTPRSAAEMAAAKRRSVAAIKKARRLFIRPQHLMCLLCLYGRGNNAPLKEDNLFELRRKMEVNPEIPVTLTEGCCMACAPCPVYDAGRHICYHAHTRNQLRDLMVLRQLGLTPGATLPARELYARLAKRIPRSAPTCGWGDLKDTTAEWKICGDVLRGYYERGLKKRFLKTHQAKKAKRKNEME